MSATIKAQVLAKAIEIWNDPEKQMRGEFHYDGAYCAMGVLRRAAFEVEGVYAFDDQDWFEGSDMSGAYRLAGFIGMTPERIIDVNDESTYGPRLLHRVMKRALAKELA